MTNLDRTALFPAVAALSGGRDADVETLVNAASRLRPGNDAWFGLTPSLDAAIPAFGGRDASVDAAIAAVQNTSICHQPSAESITALRRYGELDCTGITCAFRANGSAWSPWLMLANEWPPMSASDVLDELGDPWSFRMRFIKRFRSFDGHASIGLSADASGDIWHISRHTEIERNNAESFVGQVRTTLDEAMAALPGATSSVTDREKQAGSLERAILGTTWKHSRRMVSTTLSWRVGMPVHTVSVEVRDVRTDDATALLKLDGFDLSRFATVGSILGLLEVPAERDGHRWLRHASFEFHGGARPDVWLGVPVSP